MKLIDLLVQELPKLGGWPGGAKWIEQVSNGCLFSDNTKVSTGYCFDEKGFKKVDDWQIGRVTCEQYEAALSASKKPEWNGEGLPPVGVECEVSVDGGKTWCAYKAISERNGLRLVEIGDFTEDFQNNNWSFRPIRSDADRKRDEAVGAMLNAQSYGGQDIYCDIYDAISAGKIPGIRIE